MTSEKKNYKEIKSSFFKALSHLFIPQKDEAYIYIFLGIFTLLAVILRLYFIDNPIWYDEAYTFVKFSSRSIKIVLADYHAPNNHILNSIMVWIAYRILGNHVWIVRAPAFLISVLTVPVAFTTGRRFFGASQSLATAAVLAVATTFILNAANGRGYTLIIFLSLLLFNFAGILVKEESLAALIAYAITGALGFYTVPVFLYPMAGISLWVAASLLTEAEPWKNRWRKLWQFLLACLGSGILTLLLYSPVIIFGTGFNSIISNEIVKSQSWDSFLIDLLTRSQNTWGYWMNYASPLVNGIIFIGFMLSLLFPRKALNQRLPIHFFLLLGAAIMVLLQRVAPLPRIWSYLEMFYFFFAAAGLAWGASWILARIRRTAENEKILGGLILLAVLLTFANMTAQTQSRAARIDTTDAPEMYVAEYLAAHITEKDKVFAVAPIDIQTAYYLMVSGVPYEVFYQRDHPEPYENAYLLVRTRGDSINTLDELIDFYKIRENLNTDETETVFDYGPIFVYTIPAKK